MMLNFILYDVFKKLRIYKCINKIVCWIIISFRHSNRKAKILNVALLTVFQANLVITNIFLIPFLFSISTIGSTVSKIINC